MSDSRPIRLATRKSPLALWQANWVADELRQRGYTCELIPLTSAGDNDLRPITSTTEVGLFTKRIQQALIDCEADVAVHSLKDLPTLIVPELHLAAISQRAVVEDRLVSAAGWTLEQLPEAAIIGTSSRRRAAQLMPSPDRRVGDGLELHPAFASRSFIARRIGATGSRRDGPRR
jgi:hydroxymethylbilane synthase